MGKLTQVRRIAPWQGPSPVCVFSGGLGQLRKDGLALYDPQRGVELRRIAMEAPKGLGTTGSGLLALAAPEALAGNARVYVLPNAKEPEQVAEGYFAHSQGRSFIGVGAATEEFLLASPNARTRLGRYRIYSPSDVRVEDSLELTATDLATLISIGPGQAACLRSHQLLHFTFPAQETRANLPSAVTSARHLARGAVGSLYVSGERSIHHLAWQPSQPTVLELRATMTPEGPGEVFHLAAGDDAVAVMWLVEEPAKGNHRFVLRVYEPAGKPRFAVELGGTDLSPEEACVAVGSGYVAVGGSSSVQFFDSRSGARRG